MNNNLFISANSPSTLGQLFITCVQRWILVYKIQDAYLIIGNIKHVKNSQQTQIDAINHEYCCDIIKIKENPFSAIRFSRNKSVCPESLGSELYR